MLVLARRQAKAGEGLLIGSNIEIIVNEINSSHIKLCVNDSENITVDKWKSKIIADGVKITVEKINKSQVKLGIRAPESMAINREEVYKKDQVGNVLSSNSGVISHTKG